MTGGVASGAIMTLAGSLRHGVRARDALMFFVIGIVWCGLLAFSEQLVRGLRPGLRPVALGLIGALSALAVSCCVVATEQRVRTGSSTQAWLEVVELLRNLGHNKAEKLLIGLGTLAPFSGLGAARIGFVRLGATHPLLQIPVALICGVVSTLLLSGISSSILSLWGFATFAGGAGAAATGMALGEPLERWLLRVLRRTTDPGD